MKQGRSWHAGLYFIQKIFLNKAMQEADRNQSRTVYFQIEPAQYRVLKDRCAQSTCRSLAEYIRKLILAEPVTVNHREASLEDLITELSYTRRQLSDAVQAFEQSAQKVSAAIDEHQAAVWLKEHQKDRAIIIGLIDQIYQHSKKTALVWLQ